MADSPKKYHIKREGKVYGPYSAERLREFVRDGNVLPDDLIGDGTKWGLAKKIKGLLPSEPSPPPKPKPAPALIVSNPEPEQVKFHLRRGDQTFGPYTSDEFRAHFESGRISVTDILIFSDGSHAYVQDLMNQVSPPRVSAYPAYGQPAPAPAPQQSVLGVVDGVLNVGLKAMALYWMYESADTTDAIGDHYRHMDRDRYGD